MAGIQGGRYGLPSPPLPPPPLPAPPPLLTPRLRYPMVVWEGEAQKGGFGGGTLATASLPLRVVSGAGVLAHEPEGPQLP